MSLEILLTAFIVCVLPGLALLCTGAMMQGSCPQLAPQTRTQTSRKAPSTRRAA